MGLWTKSSARTKQCSPFLLPSRASYILMHTDWKYFTNALKAMLCQDGVKLLRVDLGAFSRRSCMKPIRDLVAMVSLEHPTVQSDTQDPKLTGSRIQDLGTGPAATQEAVGPVSHVTERNEVVVALGIAGHAEALCRPRK